MAFMPQSKKEKYAEKIIYCNSDESSWNALLVEEKWGIIIMLHS